MNVHSFIITGNLVCCKILNFLKNVAMSKKKLEMLSQIMAYTSILCMITYLTAAYWSISYIEHF
jgi:hypothetical protein